MAIVRMKKLSVLAARSQKEDLLRELMILGCVELHEQEDLLSDEQCSALLSRETGDAAEERARRASMADAIRLLDKYVPQKTPFLAPKPEMAQSAFLDESRLSEACRTAGEIVSLDEKIKSCNSEEARLNLLLEALAPWNGFELPLETNGTRSTAMLLGTLPAAVDVGEVSNSLTQAIEQSQIFEIYSDEHLHYLSVFFLREGEDAAMPVLRASGFAAPAFGSLTGTAAENIKNARAALEANAADRAMYTAQLEALAPQRDELKQCYDRLSAHVERAEASELLLRTEKVISLEGWASEPETAKLTEVLEKYGCAYELSDPAEEEYPKVPVKLKTNKFTDGLNMVTNMYSLPQYGTIDPNPRMAPFFILFYGIMMADMGYGLLMMLIGLVILKKKRPREGFMKYFAELIFEGGVATFLMGIPTAGFFGDAAKHVVRLFNPDSTFTWFWQPLFDPLQDTIYVLIGAMVLGFIHLITGQIIGMRYRMQHGEGADAFWEIVPWWVIFVGIGLMVAGIGNIGGVPVVLAIGVLMMIFGAARGAKGFGKVTAVFSSLYNGLTGWFGDILSYSRLMALMLAGSVIAQVFNTLGALPGNIFVFAIIFLIGHALNFGLNLLGCYVHDLRLQCLEFFGKFYIDGGKPFKPLAFNTKYVDIVNK